MLPVVRCLNAQRLYFRACISQSVASQAPSVFIQSKMTKCSKAFANRYFENSAQISNHSPCPRGTHQSSPLICCLNAQSVASQTGCAICSKTYNFCLFFNADNPSTPMYANPSDLKKRQRSGRILVFNARSNLPAAAAVEPAQESAASAFPRRLLRVCLAIAAGFAADNGKGVVAFWCSMPDLIFLPPQLSTRSPRKNPPPLPSREDSFVSASPLPPDSQRIICSRYWQAQHDEATALAASMVREEQPTFIMVQENVSDRRRRIELGQEPI